MRSNILPTNISSYGLSSLSIIIIITVIIIIITVIIVIIVINILEIAENPEEIVHGRPRELYVRVKKTSQ